MRLMLVANIWPAQFLKACHHQLVVVLHRLGTLVIRVVVLHLHVLHCNAQDSKQGVQYCTCKADLQEVLKSSPM